MEISVSIITISFNSRHTVEQTILSVLNQTHRPLQYVVVDGNSTDGTKDLIESYRSDFDKSGITFSYISEKDRGIADAFNKGLKLSTGRMIGFLNADDRFNDENALSRAANAFEDDNTVICGAILLENNLGIQRKLDSRPHRLQHAMYIMHPATLVPKELVNKVGLFDESFKIAMDFDFFTRLRKLGGKFKINNETPTTIMLAGGASSNINIAAREDLFIKNKYYGQKLSHYLYYYLVLSLHSVRRFISK